MTQKSLALSAERTFRTNEKAVVKLNLRNMWSRLGLTRAEVQTFHGMLRQIAFRLKQQDQDGG